MCRRTAFLVFCYFGAVVSSVPNGESLESQLFSIMDNAIGKTDHFDVIDGVSFVKTSDASPRFLQGDFGTKLANRITSFLDTYSLRLDFKDVDVRAGMENIGRALSDLRDAAEESRGKKDKKGKKQKNIIIPLILGMKAKMALLSAAMANMIAMIAGKALLVSKIALILGFMLFLKKLVQNPPKEVEQTHIKHKKIVLPQDDHGAEIYAKSNDWEKRTDLLESRWPSGYNYNLTAQEMAYRRQYSKPYK